MRQQERPLVAGPALRRQAWANIYQEHRGLVTSKRVGRPPHEIVKLEQRLNTIADLEHTQQ